MMSEEEMTYVEGGRHIIISCSRNYLDKTIKILGIIIGIGIHISEGYNN